MLTRCDAQKTPVAQCHNAIKQAPVLRLVTTGYTLKAMILNAWLRQPAALPPVPLRAIGSTTESMPLIERDYIKPDARLMNTLKSRFVLFSISEASLVADASLEASGY